MWDSGDEPYSTTYSNTYRQVVPSSRPASISHASLPLRTKFTIGGGGKGGGHGGAGHGESVESSGTSSRGVCVSDRGGTEPTGGLSHFKVHHNKLANGF